MDSEVPMDRPIFWLLGQGRVQKGVALFLLFGRRRGETVSSIDGCFFEDINLTSKLLSQNV
jgi:hypothetical protein